MTDGSVHTVREGVHERRARVPGGSRCASNGEFDWTPSTGILWRLEINIERHPRY